MSKLPTLRPPALEADIAALARSYRRANGPVMALVNRLGGGIEAQMALLPDTLRAEVERVVARALSAAHGLAGAGRRVPDMGGRAAVLAAVVTGAAGGAGGRGFGGGWEGGPGGGGGGCLRRLRNCR